MNEASPLLSVSTEKEHYTSKNDSSLFHSLRVLSTSIRKQLGSIGALGSVSIAVNFLTGPAMLELPAVFQKSGVIPTVATTVFVCVLSALCSMHMAQSISKLPGNSSFVEEVEYSAAFQHYFPRRNQRWWFFTTQFCFFICVTCLNVSSLVDSAQVFDTILANVLGSSHALHFRLGDGMYLRSWTYENCTPLQVEQGACIPFSQEGDDDDGGVIFTTGYLMNVVGFMPLALMDLKDNAAWQVVEFVVLVVTSIGFSCLFLANGIEWEGRLSWWGTSWEGMMGVVLFNFALVISIPAWLYEKEPSVNARNVIAGSSVLAAFLYIFLGVLGAMSMPHVSENMLETFMSGALGTSMQWNASIFALFIVGLGIPLLSVLCRLNLTGSGISRGTADLLAVYFPFGIAWLLYRGDLVASLLGWGGSVFTSLIAFVFPLLLGLRTTYEENEIGSIYVYGERWRNVDASRQRCILKVLLFTASTSIGFAIVGNLS